MKHRRPSKQERQSRMTLTLTLSGCVFVVTLVTLLIIGAALLIVDRTGQLGKWMEHSSILSFFLIIAAISLVGGTLMALLLGTFPLRSVSEMTQGLHRLASGDYDVRIEPKGIMATIAPLRDMVESFNATASELAGTEMLRSDFINNFSHEFKTPIVSIAGFASLLRQGDLTRAEQLEYLDIIESESKRLADMATNVLNMTKVENQAILTDVSTFNLSEQLRTCVLLLERKWEKKNLEMNLDLEEYTVSGNQELLRQVWVNLLDNAIKFSPECQTVEVSALETENDVTVSICNTGSYIPPEQQEAIFRKFYQADRSHNSEGNGIGLAVVKRVVELRELVHADLTAATKGFAKLVDELEATCALEELAATGPVESQFCENYLARLLLPLTEDDGDIRVLRVPDALYFAQYELCNLYTQAGDLEALLPQAQSLRTPSHRPPPDRAGGPDKSRSPAAASEAREDRLLPPPARARRRA